MEEKTAVEWLEQELIGHLDISNRYKNELFSKAKEMEEIQKQKKYDEGFKNGYDYANCISEKTSSIDCNCDYMTFGEHSSSCPKFKKDCQI